MAHILEDRVLESSTTTGTGALTLAGAVTGFRRFSTVCANGDTVAYFIEAIDSVGQPTGDYEYGIGTYSAANTLTRTTVLGSSNAGAAVNFPAGSKNVGLALLGARMKGSAATPGYRRNPDGTMEAWGTVTTNASGIASITWPVAFTSLYGVTWSHGAGNFSGSVNPGAVTTTVQLFNSATGANPGAGLSVFVRGVGSWI